MRLPKYLSPSSIAFYQRDPEKYYMQYLSDNCMPRDPQTQAMSVGSAFDARIKAHLYSLFVGDGNGKYEYEAMFEEQVEPHNRAWANAAGKTVFDAYQSMGGLADLLTMMGDCVKPRFEFKLEGTLDREMPLCWDAENKTYTVEWLDDHGEARETLLEFETPPPPLNLVGKPDLHFIHSSGTSVILDWKVNGFCASRRPSPASGYLKFLDRTMGPYKSYKGTVAMEKNGIKLNLERTLDMAKADWAQQLAIYGWLLGEPVGGAFVCAIDQIVCVGGVVDGVAQHRTEITSSFQERLWRDAMDLWMIIHHGHFFYKLTLDESERKKMIMDRPVSAEFARVMGLRD